MISITKDTQMDDRQSMEQAEMTDLVCVHVQKLAELALVFFTNPCMNVQVFYYGRFNKLIHNSMDWMLLFRLLLNGREIV